MQTPDPEEQKAHPHHGVRVRPNRILVLLDKNGVATLNNETPGTKHRDRVWGLPGGTIVFVIENLDSVTHRVTIPIDRFVPHAEYARPKFEPATEDPLVPEQRDHVDVPAWERRTLALRLRPFEHFQFDARLPWHHDRKLAMTYKYDIVTQRDDGASKPITLDPDLEVDRP
jgi:hypothetical protein